VATPEAFARNPELVWEFYNWRRDLIGNSHFNAGHKALAYLENHVNDFILITQNVDGLHREAGTKNLLEIHGNLWDVKCTECGLIKTDRSKDMGRLPNVVWFGESLDPDILRKSFDAAGNCDLMLIVGTSGMVHPAASLAFEAKSRGSLLAEINVEKTPQSGIMDFVLTGESGKILPMLVNGLG
jgi:NAD-dependent deacetylase